MTYADRVDQGREEVIDPLRKSYDELLAQGCAPRIAAATLRYLAGFYGPSEDIGQHTVAREYDTSSGTIRKWRQEITDHAIEELRNAGALEYTVVPNGGGGGE